MNISRQTKLDVKLKDVHFEGGSLIDEDGEVYEISSLLEKIFKNNEFTLTATVSKKTEYAAEDFAD